MQFSIDIRNLKGLQDEIEDLMERAPLAAARVGNFVAQSTAQRAKNLIRTSTPTGRSHFVNGSWHRSSAPGQPPANMTGALVQSITFTKMTDRRDSFATAGSTISYARTLEYGGWTTKDAQFGGGTVYIEPRPFLLPSFMAAVQSVKGMLKREFESL